jgi:hypothetical protein
MLKRNREGTQAVLLMLLIAFLFSVICWIFSLVFER